MDYLYSSEMFADVELIFYSTTQDHQQHSQLTSPTQGDTASLTQEETTQLTYRAHKAILASSSGFFKKVLKKRKKRRSAYERGSRGDEGVKKRKKRRSAYEKKKNKEKEDAFYRVTREKRRGEGEEMNKVTVVRMNLDRIGVPFELLQRVFPLLLRFIYIARLTYDNRSRKEGTTTTTEEDTTTTTTASTTTTTGEDNENLEQQGEGGEAEGGETNSGMNAITALHILATQFEIAAVQQICVLLAGRRLFIFSSSPSTYSPTNKIKIKNRACSTNGRPSSR